MEHNLPLSTALDKVISSSNENSLPIDLYLIIDGSGSVNQTQFAMMKNSCRLILEFFKFEDSEPHPTRCSLIQFDSNVYIHARHEGKKTKLINLLEAMDQKGGGTNTSKALLEVQNLIQRQGRSSSKLAIIFTDGDVNAKSQVNDLIASKIEIVCALITQNDSSINVDSMTEIFGLSRLMVFKTFVELENYIKKISIKTIEAPNMIEKCVGTREIRLQFENPSNAIYERFYVDYYEEGQNDWKQGGSTATGQLKLAGLEPDTIYYMRAYGEKGNIKFKHSPVKEIKTLSERSIACILKDENILKKELGVLRENLNSYKLDSFLQEAGVKYFNICLFGEMGNGKSSFINTIYTALQPDSRKFINKVNCGKAQESFTRGLSKIEINEFTRIWDVWGWQANKDYKEFEYLVKGSLREGFKENGQLSPENMQVGLDINEKPHCFITIADIFTSVSENTIKKFGEFYRMLKSEKDMPTLVAMTKFDMLKDENGNNIIQKKFKNVYDHGTINSMIEDFAALSQSLTPEDIHAVFNYAGSNEDRNPVKDYLALSTFWKAIQDVEQYFTKFKFIKIYDQFNCLHLTIPLESLDLSLEDFQTQYFSKISKSVNNYSLKFKPNGFYISQTLNLVPETNWAYLRLEKCLYDKKITDKTMQYTYTCYTLRLENLITPDTFNPSPQKISPSKSSETSLSQTGSQFITMTSRNITQISSSNIKTESLPIKIVYKDEPTRMPIKIREYSTLKSLRIHFETDYSFYDSNSNQFIDPDVEDNYFIDQIVNSQRQLLIGKKKVSIELVKLKITCKNNPKEENTFVSRIPMKEITPDGTIDQLREFLSKDFPKFKLPSSLQFYDNDGDINIASQEKFIKIRECIQKEGSAFIMFVYEKPN